MFYFSIYLKSTENKNEEHEFISRVGNRQTVLSEKEIQCFYTENKTVFAITENMNKHILDLSLEKIINQISSIDFFKVNRQYILKKSSIKELKSEANNRLSLKTIFDSEISTPIIISRKNTPLFRKWFNS